MLSKKFKSIALGLSFAICFSTISSIKVFASEINNTPATKVVNTQIPKTQPGSHTKASNPGVLAIYTIPGIGQVALLATGAVVVGGVAYYAGSAIYNKVSTWLASRNEPVDVSDRDGWIEVGSQNEIQQRVDGDVQPGKQGAKQDGTIVKEVKDAETGKVIGEIHLKQPEYYSNGKATGRKYPTHYHDNINRLGNGSDAHYWWR